MEFYNLPGWKESLQVRWVKKMCLGYGGTATMMRQVLLKTAKDGEFIEYNFL